ncbi:hypothetical protein QFC21_003163 [Naganishia friedmannii]|uniref:Uncharacterized protein n=1 Tax=Naganishia friedmannii TaxID=89922 RepID=A0ACC2VRT1_9TREE|nr:hypothetical protein QFC21_003163 [Naganishia friedmannii]
MSSSPLRRHSLAIGPDSSPSRLPQPSFSPSSPGQASRSVSSSGLPVLNQGRTFSPATSRPPSELGYFAKNGTNAVGSPLPARFGRLSSREQVPSVTLSTPKAQSPETITNDDGHVHVVLRIRPSYTPPESDIPQRFQRVVLRPTTSDPTHEVTVQQPSELSRTAGTQPSNPLGSAKGKSNSFRYNSILPEECTQIEAYEVSAKPAIDKFLKGFNVTILAYGQTSSGKSYTMGTTGSNIDYSAGGDMHTGIIPRAVKDMFERLEQDRMLAAGSLSWECKISFLELYNEDLIDLLSQTAHNQSTSVTIREDKGKILWSGLREVKVTSTEEVMRLLHEGSTRRQIGETGMNKESSRSHAVFSLSLVQRKRSDNGARAKNFSRPISSPVSAYSGLSRGGTPTGTRPGSRTSMMPPPTSAIRQFATSPSTPARGSPEEDTASGGWVEIVSKFHFVDLAGSERLKRTAALGERMKEGISINAGLTALGNVISALAEPASKHAHIPYRDSKLTRLLQDSLGGNSYTIMIACVSPIEYNLNETINTLRYGARARNIKNRAEANQVEVGWDDLIHLQGVVVKLRKDLEILRQASERGDVGDLPGSSVPDDLMERARVKLLETHQISETLRSQVQMQNLEIARLIKQLQTAKQRKSDESDTSGLAFSQMVEPIIDEYEKTIINLEAEIERLKASLQISETLAEQHVEQIALKNQRLEAQEAYIHELRTRITNYAQRERDLEENIRQVEVQISATSSQKGDHGPVIRNLQQQLAKQKDTLSFNAISLAELESRLETADDRIEDLTRQIQQLEKEAEQRVPASRAPDVFDGGDETPRTSGGDLDDNESGLVVKVPGSPAPEKDPSDGAKTLEDERQTTDYMLMQADHAKTLAELAIIKAQYQETLLSLAEISAQLPPMTCDKVEDDPVTITKAPATGSNDEDIEGKPTAELTKNMADQLMPEAKRTADEEDTKSTAQSAQDFQVGRGKSKAHSSRSSSSSEERSSSPSFHSSWGKSGSSAYKAIANARLRQCSPTPGGTSPNRFSTQVEPVRFAQTDGDPSQKSTAVKLTDEAHTRNFPLSDGHRARSPRLRTSEMAVTSSQATLCEATSDNLPEHMQQQIELVNAEVQEKIGQIESLRRHLSNADRNLRKMRTSMQEAISTRDTALVNSDLMRGELAQLKSEIATLQQSSTKESGSLENQLWEEKKAREKAQAQVEELMDAMQQMPKFRCF